MGADQAAGEAVLGLDACVERVVHPDRVQLAVDAALPAESLGQAAALFKLLGDPTRARLLYALLEVGELCVCDLAAATATQEATVSQSLRLLRASGVVTGRRDGRLVYYRLADAHVRMLLDLTREHVGHEGSSEGQDSGMPGGRH
jgi:DNA-binding transcriptional ArsR family regulator